jgi:hypothetical protein
LSYYDDLPYINWFNRRSVSTFLKDNANLAIAAETSILQMLGKADLEVLAYPSSPKSVYLLKLNTASSWNRTSGGNDDSKLVLPFK